MRSSEPSSRMSQPSNAADHIADIHSLGLKATAPRIKVLRVFQQAQQRHLSADDVYKILLAQGADVGLATVYRVLMQFEQAGLLSRQHFEAGKAVFELNEGRHHDHLVCLRCGQVLEFTDSAIERRQQEIARERGFELQEHALALYGVCSDQRCRANNPPPRRTNTTD
jgi:Fur family transcriptional regulator, ferric uptake regulator